MGRSVRYRPRGQHQARYWLTTAAESLGGGFVCWLHAAFVARSGSQGIRAVPAPQHR